MGRHRKAGGLGYGHQRSVRSGSRAEKARFWLQLALRRCPNLRSVGVGRAFPAWGLVTPPEAARSAAVKALLDPMVGEAYAHVQGESLKAYAALLWRLTNSPITRPGKRHAAHRPKRKEADPDRKSVV